MHYLKLAYTLEPHPYSDEVNSMDEVWAIIKLEIYNSKDLKIDELLSIQWDIKILLHWFQSNESFLLAEEIPIEIDNDISLAEAIFKFYDDVDPEQDDDKIEALYEYRIRHGLSFALRGVDIAEIYIGKGKNTYEISFFNEDESWIYFIDLKSFLGSIKQISEAIAE